MAGASGSERYHAAPLAAPGGVAKGNMGEPNATSTGRTPRASISVAMATFNGAAHVRQQLESIAAQTVRPAELVVGDDGSADGTPELVEAFATSAPFPVALTRNPKRLGAAENFLAICARTREPLIALSDWDDVWEPMKLERILPWFDDPRVTLVVHRSIVVDEALRPLGRTYPAIRRTTMQAPRHVDPWLAVPGMAMVFRRSILDAVAGRRALARPREAGGLPLDHDDWLYLLAGSLGRVVFLAEDLARYRQHGASYMGAPGGDQREHVDRALRLDAAYFHRQAAMFRSRRELWRSVAADASAEAGVRRAAGLSATWNDRLARLSDARAGVRDQTRGRLSRIGRLVRLAVSGGYVPPTRAGLGVRALAADVLSLLRARLPARAGDAPADLARRVAADRAAGRTPEAIITELTAEGVAPLYGRRWSPEMIRDLVFQARRSTEAEAVAAEGAAAAAEPRVYAPPDQRPR